MVTAEMIYRKAQRLDPFRLQELADFLEFLLHRDTLADYDLLLAQHNAMTHIWDNDEDEVWDHV